MSAESHIVLKLRRGLKADLPSPIDGELVFCTDTGEIFIGRGGLHKYAGFISSNPTDWNGAPPEDLKAAIDRLSSALAGLLGGPIP